MILDRWEGDYSYSINMVKKTLCLLWAARRGLTETEIREMLGDSLCDREIGDSTPDWTRGMITNHRPFPIPGHFWSPLYIAMEGHVRQVGGLVSIADERWLEVIQERYMPTAADQAKVREWLAGYFMEFYWRESVHESMRCLEEVPSQYLLAGDWDSAAAFLSSPGSLATAWYLGGVAVIDAWSRIEANSPIRVVDAYSAFIRCPDKLKPGERTALASFLVATGHLAEAAALSAASSEEPSSAKHDNL